MDDISVITAKELVMMLLMVLEVTVLELLPVLFEVIVLMLIMGLVDMTVG